MAAERRCVGERERQWGGVGGAFRVNMEGISGAGVQRRRKRVKMDALNATQVKPNAAITPALT